MDNWFTIEQIDRDTFSISEYKHWEETHCYLLCGEKCAILIDTGLGVSNIRKIVDSLTELPVMAVTTYDQFKRSGKKPSEFCKTNLRMHDVKSYDFVKQYFSNPQLLVKAIKEYRRTANIPKGEYSLSDLLR